MNEEATERTAADVAAAERAAAADVRIENLDRRITILETVNNRLMWFVITPVLTAILSIVIIK